MQDEQQRKGLRDYYDLFDLGILDGPREKAFDNIVSLVSRMLGAPVSLITIIDDLSDRQHFKAQIGLLEPYATQMETPISHSFCKHVRDRNAPLIFHLLEINHRLPAGPLQRIC